MVKKEKSREDILNSFAPNKKEKKFFPKFNFGYKIRQFFSNIGYSILGAFSAVGMQPWSYEFVFILCFLFLFYKIDTLKRKKDVFRVSFFFGWGHFLLSGYWIISAFFIDQKTIEEFAWAGYLIVFAGASLFALFFAFPAWLSRFTERGLKRLITFASLFALFEVLRGELAPKTPWNLVGSIWYDYLNPNNISVLQSISIIGVYGLSFLTILLFLSPYLLISRDVFISIKKLDFKSKPIKKRLYPVIGILSVFIVIFMYGKFRILSKTEFVNDYKIRLVQPMTISSRSKTYESRMDDFNKHIAFTKLKPLDDIDLIIWGETAVTLDVLNNPLYKAKAVGIIPDNAHLIFGFDRIEKKDGYKFWNSLAVFNSNGDVKGSYDKVKLIPFGEYVPKIFRDIFKQTVATMQDFQSGKTRNVIKISENDPSFIPSICYEIIFPDYLIKGQRSDYILNISNDSWFGMTSGPYQHFLASILRSIEEGVPVVRGTRTGISAVVDPYGRLVIGDAKFRKFQRGDYIESKADMIPLMAEGIMDVKLPKKINQTIFSYIGNLIGFILIFAGFIFGFMPVFKGFYKKLKHAYISQ